MKNLIFLFNFDFTKYQLQICIHIYISIYLIIHLYILKELHKNFSVILIDLHLQKTKSKKENPFIYFFAVPSKRVTNNNLRSIMYISHSKWNDFAIYRNNIFIFQLIADHV